TSSEYLFCYINSKNGEPSPNRRLKSTGKSAWANFGNWSRYQAQPQTAFENPVYLHYRNHTHLCETRTTQATLLSEHAN
ncbi:MAG: hypothetical protein MUP90_08530, partial [Gammaproteobacteria bacterium]|nr:hypothetical protein [Gammaproteobacteria bacterium]